MTDIAWALVALIVTLISLFLVFRYMAQQPNPSLRQDPSYWRDEHKKILRPLKVEWLRTQKRWSRLSWAFFRYIFELVILIFCIKRGTWPGRFDLLMTGLVLFAAFLPSRLELIVKLCDRYLDICH